MVGMDEKDIFVGHEAKELKDVMNIESPIQRGQIINWDQMENVWHHCFYHELKMAPEDHRCFMAESPLNTRQNREKIANVMFENFNFPYFYISV
jgi:actin, other eukaryote